MPQMSRLVIPKLPHHVVQRGNRRQRVFFKEADKRLYLKILRDQSSKYGLSFWAYCLMDNHVHLIAVPQEKEALASAIGETHKRYTLHINRREGWRGYLWQGRFSSYAMNERHLYSAIRYVELNPVRAKMVDRPEDYLWSSARAHILGTEDPLLEKNSLLDEFGDWKRYLSEACAEEELETFEGHIRNGRPLGPLGRPLGTQTSLCT